jgi:hypothetical protein
VSLTCTTLTFFNQIGIIGATIIYTKDTTNDAVKQAKETAVSFACLQFNCINNIDQ